MYKRVQKVLKILSRVKKNLKLFLVSSLYQQRTDSNSGSETVVNESQLMKKSSKSTFIIYLRKYRRAIQ